MKEQEQEWNLSKKWSFDFFKVDFVEKDEREEFREFMKKQDYWHWFDIIKKSLGDLSHKLISEFLGMTDEKKD